MHRLFSSLVIFIVVALAQSQALPRGYNYDESMAASAPMLDPMRTDAGKVIATRKAWLHHRREILAQFRDDVYGHTPTAARDLPLHFRILEPDTPALRGLATRRQVLIPLTPAGERGPVMHLLLYLPARRSGPVPVILGLNFDGNAAITDDPGIDATDVWQAAKVRGAPPQRVEFSAAQRGTRSSEWQAEMILKHGYGLATVYYGDIQPDFKNASQLGIRGWYAKADWGAIDAWSWGLSQALDYLLTDREIDRDRIAVTGHSRLGKAADWAAAQDTRFAALLSTESGKGGQSLYHRDFGETIAHLEHSFPYWFCPEFAKWVGHDSEIPVDGNLLLALIAPRPLYVASAQDDLFSDPKGEFLSAESVGPVYGLFGKRGLGVTQVPPVNDPVMNDVAYDVRSGGHDVTAYDWEQYLRFLDAEFGSPRQPAKAEQ